MKKLSEYKSLKPVGHYSIATVHKDTVYVSGQLPIDLDTGEKVLGDFKTQVLTVLGNLKEVLEAVASSLDKVLKITVYIPDVKLWDEVDAIYKEFFGNHKPARVVVPTRNLHYGFSIEIDAIAYI